MHALYVWVDDTTRTIPHVSCAAFLSLPPYKQYTQLNNLARELTVPSFTQPFSRVFILCKVCMMLCSYLVSNTDTIEHTPLEKVKVP